MSNLIPVSRKEQYLSKIDGMTNKSPDKTYTKEEYFFSEILGEALHKPVLETRYEMYLAKIAGREIGIPYPETRLERFLAKAAGMNISVPTPITREEMYWSTYSPFYLSNSSGTSPFTYGKCKIGTLSNYRIYGNTVDGNSVGDRTANLFEAELVNYNVNANGQISALTDFILSIAPVIAGTTYTISNNQSANAYAFYQQYPKPESYSYNSSRYVFNENSITIVAPIDGYIVVRKAASDPPIMLNAGSTPLPYEPYGYKVPVTVSNGTDTLTTPIYLPEPIKMVGDEAEYIDYREQKQHRVRKNLWSGIVEQGSVSTTGDYAYDIKRIRSKNVPIKPGAYTISCNLVIRCIYAYNNNEKVSCVVDNGGGAIYSNTFTVPSDANNVSIGLRSFDASGAEIDVTTSDFEWGQIEKGSEVTTYEPYIENADLDVTLPALPTLPGTNVLSVGTAVQPSHIFAEFDKEREYG